MNIAGKRNLRKLLGHHARTQPDKTFLVYEDGEERAHAYTYRQFDSMVNRTANGLLRLGVSKGDRVHIHLTNCPEFLFFWFATAKIGAVMVPTSPLSPAEELSYPVAHSESIISVTQPDLLPAVQAVRESCPDIRRVVLCGSEDAPVGGMPFSSLVKRQPEELAPVPLDALDDAAVMYTSGTTSRPKGVIITHANYIYGAEVVSKLIRLGPEDRHLVVLPLFHANAQYYSVMTAMLVGASVALTSRFSSSRYMRQATRHQCTVASLFAAPMRMVLAQPPRPSDRGHRLRLAMFAQNLTEAQLTEWDRRFGVPLIQIYGMTETSGQPLANPLDYPRKNMTMGMVTLGNECKVVDGRGSEVPPGVAGELLVRGIPGETIFKGYLKDPKATDEAIRDGWLWTGDIVEVDEEGYFRFVDRAKDIIKRAGENVAASEVEAVVKQHPRVADAAVIGIPDPLRDESIKAFVILGPGETATEEEVIEFCRARLSKFRVPEFIEFRDRLPRTSVGKIQKHLLRREDAARRRK
jgi:crotonobetaine/carnitine-CoA ligase